MFHRKIINGEFIIIESEKKEDEGKGEGWDLSSKLTSRNVDRGIESKVCQ
jgi:hypothetical protein